MIEGEPVLKLVGQSGVRESGAKRNICKNDLARDG